LGPYEVSLFTGINPLIKLGDPQGVVGKAMPLTGSKVDLSEFSDFPDCKIVDGLIYKKLGITAYFNRSGAVLIILEEPFKGNIRSKKINLFALGPSPGAGTWSDFLNKELGSPDFVVTGGSLNSTGFFYSWGDISFNASGPNQVALYRDPAVRKYREKFFGRRLKILPEATSIEK
jgi:hypothetical protein